MRLMRAVIVVAALFLVLSACATGTPLKTVEVGKGEDIPGLFTVIFFGRHYEEEIDAMVVLDLEGDEYTLSPTTRQMDFETLKSVNISEALYEAIPFFRLHYAFSGETKVLRVQDLEGKTIGYEIRPLYDKRIFGMEDVLNSEYLIGEGGKVIFSAKPKALARIGFGR